MKEHKVVRCNSHRNKEEEDMSIFTGAGVAIVTPFHEDGSVNYEAFKEQIERQIAGGTDAIIVCGTTGESSTLTHEEHLDVIRYCVKVVNKRIPVIAGTGSNCTETAIYLSTEAEKAGVDGLLIVTQYPGQNRRCADPAGDGCKAL